MQTAPAATKKAKNAARRTARAEPVAPASNGPATATTTDVSLIDPFNPPPPLPSLMHASE